MKVCPICDRKDSIPFLELKRSPYLQNILLPDRDTAQAIPATDVHFRYCPHCHFVFNPDFQEDKCDYTQGYNNDQLRSSGYRHYVDEMADRLIGLCGLDKDSRILEIGCGDGYFLSRLREKLSCDQIVGYELRYAGSHGMDACIRRKYFTRDDVAAYDLIIFRHTLEGLLRFDEILENVLASMHERSFLYIETPNLDDFLRQKNLGALCHEIARYFSVRACDRLLVRRGMVLEHAESVFGGNYLFLLARRTPDPAAAGTTYQRLVRVLEGFLRPIVWGATGRTISTLCHLGLGPDRVLCAVDIDPGKQGKFLPGTAQEVLAPEAALALAPDLILVANANYLDEIIASVNRDMHYLLLDGRLYHGSRGTLALVRDDGPYPGTKALQNK